MSIAILIAVIAALMYITVFTHLVSFFLRNSYIPGSYRRYIANSLMLATSGINFVIGVILGGLYFAIGDYIAAGVFSLGSLGWLWVIKKDKDEDNWFNDQWKRLKRGLKNLRQRLATTSPLPSPA